MGAGTPTASIQSAPRPEFSDEVVVLQNGPDSNAFSVKIRKELLDKATSKFRGTSEPHIISVKVKNLVFRMFVDWLHGPEDPVPFIPCQYSQQPWRSHAVDAWLFAHQICASGFEKYALSQVVKNCSLQNRSYFAKIEKKTTPQSALLRFSNHWVAWNVYLAPEGQSEYKRLAAAKLANAVNPDTNDPRIYEVEHWYASCGDDFNSSCIHDPIVRENAVNALFESRKPQPTWGFQFEEEHVHLWEKPTAQSPPPKT